MTATTTTYTIEQHTGQQWEPLDEADYETRSGALLGMAELERRLSWRGLRVVETISDETTQRRGEVVAVGRA